MGSARDSGTTGPLEHGRKADFMAHEERDPLDPLG
jgi:hypothetical protein